MNFELLRWNNTLRPRGALVGLSQGFRKLFCYFTQFVWFFFTEIPSKNNVLIIFNIFSLVFDDIIAVGRIPGLESKNQNDLLPYAKPNEKRQ